MDTCALCPKTSELHGHHDIPRAFGGVNGPQTLVCASHHNLAHNLANQLYRHGQEELLEIPSDVLPGKRKELLRLVRTIVIARRRYEKARNDGMAPVQGTAIKNDGTRHQRLKDIARLQSCSLQQAQAMAIDRLWQSLVTQANNAKRSELK